MTQAPPDPWTVAIHATRGDREPLGAGVLIDRSVVLTSAHVVEGRDTVWIAFPKDPNVARGDRREARVPLRAHDIDLVKLELLDPAPPSITAARLRCAPATDLSRRPWWSFGFPRGMWDVGSSAHGEIGDPLAYGHVYVTSTSDHRLEKGFSGGALWSAEHEAVVGLIVHAVGGDGHALVFDYADRQVPELKLSALAQWHLADADDTALAAWGWRLATDDEARRHWLPRARGVASNVERGARFRGRDAALRALVSWLDAPMAAGRALVVTGSPGVGKSAVLGRVVTTADSDVNAALPPDDEAVRATTGSVSCAVHAKGKNALEIATEIARAASVALPADAAALMPALRDRLTRKPSRFNLVLDALDEVVTPKEARKVVSEIMLPVVRQCAKLGAQVIVGTRRADDLGDLLGMFGGDAEVIDLDSSTYFAESDLADYALATLMMVGAERPGNPYSDARVALPVARRIAALADGNFLVAGLVARARALRDTAPVAPDRVAFPARVADALDGYVHQLPPAGQTPARLALTALAYAETPGLPLSLWRSALEAFGATVTEEELVVFARTSAANFLIETGGATGSTYRLFHQALNEALLAARAEQTASESDEGLLVTAWLRDMAGVGWSNAPAYLLRSLPRHAARAGMVDALLADDGFLAHAQLDRLVLVADAATTERGQARGHLLRRTPLALRAAAPDRFAQFSVVEKLDGLASDTRPDPGAPYRAIWARTPSRQERSVLTGHQRAVHDVTAVPVDGRCLLASGGEDGKVRLWDPLTGQTEEEIDCHGDECVTGLSAVRAGPRTLLATSGHDRTVRLWDPRSGVAVHVLRGHGDWVRNLCAVPTPDGRELLASASDDRTVRLWDPETGSEVHVLAGHTGWVTAVCYVPGVELLASAGFDGRIRLWDPVTGREAGTLAGHDGWVRTLTAVRGTHGFLIASAGYDAKIRVWRPDTGEGFETDAGASPVTDLVGLTADGRTLLAATAQDGAIRLWDVATGISLPSLEGHAGWFRAICELPVGDRNLLATAGNDGVVRLWDPMAEQPRGTVSGRSFGPVRGIAGPLPGGEVALATTEPDAPVLLDLESGADRGDVDRPFAALTDVLVFRDGGRDMLAMATADRVVTWDIIEGSEVVSAQVHFEAVNTLCAVAAGDRTLVASGADDNTVRLWDPTTGVERVRPLSHPSWVTALTSASEGLISADKDGTLRRWSVDGALLWRTPGAGEGINALCTVDAAGRHLLVSGGDDRTVRLWNPDDGAPVRGLTGHTEPVTGVCALSVDGRSTIASASLDRTVRLWDPITGRQLQKIVVHDPALCCRFVGGVLVIGLDRGVLALTVQ